MLDSKRLERQIHFIVEIDKLKTILRETILMDRSRYENSAEHSWHLAVMAVLLAEYAPAPDLDMPRVLKMLLVHDVVEIDAGDTYCYDESAHHDKSEREARAAERIFGLLPADQKQELRALWDEFEAQLTPEAQYAAVIDRLQPLLHNYHTNGQSWRKNGIKAHQVLARNEVARQAAPALWCYAASLIEDAVARGLLVS